MVKQNPESLGYNPNAFGEAFANTLLGKIQESITKKQEQDDLIKNVALKNLLENYEKVIRNLLENY
jgi:hypothetical protein